MNRRERTAVLAAGQWLPCEKVNSARDRALPVGEL